MQFGWRCLRHAFSRVRLFAQWRPPLDSPTGRRKSTSKSRTVLTMDALQRRPRFITWNQASQERRFLDKDHARQG